MKKTITRWKSYRKWVVPTSFIDGLAINGKLMVLAATVDPVKVAPLQLIMGRKSIAGWPSGTEKDFEDTLVFSARTNTLPIVETYPLEKAAEAYEQMITNKTPFKMVLIWNSSSSGTLETAAAGKYKLPPVAVSYHLSCIPFAVCTVCLFSYWATAPSRHSCRISEKRYTSSKEL